MRKCLQDICVPQSYIGISVVTMWSLPTQEKSWNFKAYYSKWAFLSSPVSFTLACAAINVKRVTNYLDPWENFCRKRNTSSLIYCLAASYLVNVVVIKFENHFISNNLPPTFFYYLWIFESIFNIWAVLCLLPQSNSLSFKRKEISLRFTGRWQTGSLILPETWNCRWHLIYDNKRAPIK